MTEKQTDEQLHRIAQKLDHRVAEKIINLKPNASRFVAGVVERWARGPFAFSDAQRSWLEDLEEEHL